MDSVLINVLEMHMHNCPWHTREFERVFPFYPYKCLSSCIKGNCIISHIVPLLKLTSTCKMAIHLSCMTQSITQYASNGVLLYVIRKDVWPYGNMPFTFNGKKITWNAFTSLINTSKCLGIIQLRWRDLCLTSLKECMYSYECGGLIHGMYWWIDWAMAEYWK